MKWRRRHWILAAVAAAALLAVTAVDVVLDLWTREPPNYSKIEDGFFLGGRVPRPPPGTRAVLNICESEDVYQAEVHRWDPIRDAAPPPSIDWLRRQVKFLDDQHRAGLPIYVHCHAGVSRGATVTVAYFMWRNGWPLEQTLDFVRSKRNVIRPNPVFIELLKEWEKSLGTKGK